ncbi:MAG: UbiA family prenyltransferase [Caldilineaceae bacterium]
MAACINLPFLLIYLTIFGMATAYSHPSIRLKGHPIWGLMTVGLGQGVLAALGGWVVAQPNLAALDMGAWLGITAVTLVTIGFYPITQIYQIDEDLARGIAPLRRGSVQVGPFDLPSWYRLWRRFY